MISHNFRHIYHQALCKDVLFLNKDGVPSNAETQHKRSIFLAQEIAGNLGFPLRTTYIRPQLMHERFKRITAKYLMDVFQSLKDACLEKWFLATGKEIGKFDEFKELVELEKTLSANRILDKVLDDYIAIKPDIVVGRMPVASMSSRQKNQASPIPHASISCKWTIRSDRSQNARTEALNLIRNRKGNLPHIVAVTAEPLPNRISTLAFGTGDLDCVYHFALPELKRAIEKSGNEDQLETLNMMIDGRRLRDISDLPFDLAI